MNAPTQWTAEADRKLLAGIAAGMSASQIARSFGNGCTRNMIIGRHARIRKIRFPYLIKMNREARIAARAKRQAYAARLRECLAEFDRRLSQGEQRDWVIQSIHRRGVYLSDIGKHIGVSRERVRQIVAEAA